MINLAGAGGQSYGAGQDFSGGDFSGGGGPQSSLTTSNISGLASGALSLVGGFLGASGAQAAGKAQAQAFQDQAQTAGNNAQRTNFSLGEQAVQSNYQEQKLLGRQQADYGAAGVSPNAGSPLDVMRDTRQQYKTEGLNRFYSSQFAGQAAAQQSNYDAQAASAALQAGKTNATATILGGLGKAAVGALPLLLAAL